MKDQVVSTQTQSQFDEAPLYVRWNADLSAYAIEMRLDVIGRIAGEMKLAEKQGVEIGGILIGSQPSEPSPTLRIDDFEIIRRRAEDGSIFMLDPKERDRFLTSRWDTTMKGRSGIGFFRTHLRPGPMQPSLADKTLLSQELREKVHSILLISGTEPYTAAFFIGAESNLSETPSIPEFRFDENEFRSLPEVSTRPGSNSRSSARWRWYAGMLLVLLLALCAELYHLKTSGGSDPNSIELAIAGSDILDISWNRSASDLKRATSAKLSIIDGPSRREILLGQDELRLGRVRYHHFGSDVKVILQLRMPDSTSTTQSATWSSAS